jgi:hypothetical protein
MPERPAPPVLSRLQYPQARPGSASRTRTPVSGRRASQPAGASTGGAMPLFGDWRRDWTNRQAAGVGLLVASLAMLIGFARHLTAEYVACGLAVAGIALLLQDWWLKSRGHRPKIDRRLELIEEKPSLTIPESQIERQIAATNPTAPYPAHALTVRLGVRKKIDPPILLVECNAPIYMASGFLHVPREEDRLMFHDLAIGSQERATLQFGSAALPAGASLLVMFYSVAPLRLRRVEPTRLPAPPPADHPSSKASA